MNNINPEKVHQIILLALDALEKEVITEISSTDCTNTKICLISKLENILLLNQDIEEDPRLVFSLHRSIPQAKEPSDHLKDAMMYAAQSFRAKTNNHLDDNFRMALKNQMVSLPPTSFKGFDPGALNHCAYCDSEIPGIDNRKDWPDQRSEIGICLPCWSEMDNPPALPDSPGYEEETPQIQKKVAKKKPSSKKPKPKLPKTTNEACDHLEYREV